MSFPYEVLINPATINKPWYNKRNQQEVKRTDLDRWVGLLGTVLNPPPPSPPLSGTWLGGLTDVDVSGSTNQGTKRMTFGDSSLTIPLQDITGNPDLNFTNQFSTLIYRLNGNVTPVNFNNCAIMCPTLITNNSNPFLHSLVGTSLSTTSNNVCMLGNNLSEGGQVQQVLIGSNNGCQGDQNIAIGFENQVNNATGVNYAISVGYVNTVGVRSLNFGADNLTGDNCLTLGRSLNNSTTLQNLLIGDTCSIFTGILNTGIGFNISMGNPLNNNTFVGSSLTGGTFMDQSVNIGFQNVINNSVSSSVLVGDNNNLDGSNNVLVGTGSYVGCQLGISLGKNNTISIGHDNSICIGNNLATAGLDELYVIKNLTPIVGTTLSYNTLTGQVGPAVSSEKYKEIIGPVENNEFDCLFDNITVVKANYKQGCQIDLTCHCRDKKTGLKVKCKDISSCYTRKCAGYDFNTKCCKNKLHSLPSLVAEDMYDIDKLKRYVGVDAEGKPDNVNYLMLIPILIQEITNLRRRLEVLEKS